MSENVFAKRVQVEAILSFGGVRKGDKAYTHLTPTIKTYISMGYMRVVEEVQDGGSPDRQSGDSEGGAEGGDE